MIPSSGEGSKVLWSELFPYELKRKLKECPIVYLPMGLCEPHGQISAFGLDIIKAEWLCQETARRVGGVVAPTQGYHIHESGYHARWLEEVVGEENPHMTGMPPDVVLRFFLYQLRAFANAGFKAIMVLTGHSGGNQHDMRRAAEHFMRVCPVQVWVASDPELVADQFEGDHAGNYEISQLMYLRNDLISKPLHLLEHEPGSGGKFALGQDALEATGEHGEQIMKACLNTMCLKAEELKQLSFHDPTTPPLRPTYTEVEAAWAALLQEKKQWVTANPWAGQLPVSKSSVWKPYEFL